MKKWLISTILAAASIVSFAALPSGDGAKALIEQSSTELLNEMRANKATYQANPSAFETFVNSKVAPHLAFDKMAEIALGRHLQEVKAAGKFNRFRDAFRQLLIRVYSKGWTDYSNATVKVIGTPVVDQYSRAKVRTKVTNNDGKTSNMIFDLWYTNGKWKIYDATFANVSLITGYRNSFDTELKNSGIDALINKMQSMN